MDKETDLKAEEDLNKPFNLGTPQSDSTATAPLVQTRQKSLSPNEDPVETK